VIAIRLVLMAAADDVAIVPPGVLSRRRT